MSKITKYILIVSASVLALTGCSSFGQKLSCTDTDWYEIGRREGAQGKPNTNGKGLLSVCPDGEDREDAFAKFENGRSLGLAEFCSVSNGFEMGRLNQKLPKDICPQILEEALKEGYSRGQKATSLEEARRDVYLRIKTLRRELELSGLSLARRGLLEGERLELESKRQELDQQLSQVRTSVDYPQVR